MLKEEIQEIIKKFKTPIDPADSVIVKGTIITIIKDRDGVKLPCAEFAAQNWTSEKLEDKLSQYFYANGTPGNNLIEIPTPINNVVEDTVKTVETKEEALISFYPEATGLTLSIVYTCKIDGSRKDHRDKALEILKGLQKRISDDFPESIAQEMILQITKS